MLPRNRSLTSRKLKVVTKIQLTIFKRLATLIWIGELIVIAVEPNAHPRIVSIIAKLEKHNFHELSL